MNVNPYVEKYKKYLELSKERIDELLSRIVDAESIKDKEIIARKAAKAACDSATGYYSSNIIEKAYTDIAQSHSVELQKEYKPNSFLHVMTEAYLAGGHTRVVERWILASDKSQCHSVIFTEDKTVIMPQVLRDAVKEKNGTITELSSNVSYIERALKLRQIASSYEYVILHVHPFDVIPLVAFGTTEFKRPVIFYNHADHVFWLGISIADIVADLKSLGQAITLNQRKASKSFILGVPMSLPDIVIKTDKENARKKLNLPTDKKIILSYGAQYKYKPLLDLNFFDYITRVTQRANVLVIVIGVEKRWYSEWETFAKEHPDKLMGLHGMPHAKLLEYVAVADLIIDSFPMPGITAVIDGISAGIPVLSLRNLVGQQDYILESMAYCGTMDELVEKSFQILDSDDYANENICDISKKMYENFSTDVFRQKLNELYKQTPRVHQVHIFESKTPSQFIDCDAFAIHTRFKETLLINLFGAFKVIKRKIAGAQVKEYEIKILNKSFFIIHKKQIK